MDWTPGLLFLLRLGVTESRAAPPSPFDGRDHPEPDQTRTHDAQAEQGLCLVPGRPAEVENPSKGGRDQKRDLESIEEAKLG